LAVENPSPTKRQAQGADWSDCAGGADDVAGKCAFPGLEDDTGCPFAGKLVGQIIEDNGNEISARHHGVLF
jgi:hypothetical protein